MGMTEFLLIGSIDGWMDGCMKRGEFVFFGMARRQFHENIFRPFIRWKKERKGNEGEGR